MGPKPSQPQSGELFRPRLDEQLNMKHPLVRLAALIDWAEIERSFAVSFTSGRGRPALPPRLVAGLLYLQHTFDALDEAVPVLAALLWRDLPADRVAHRSVQPDTLEKAHWRRRRRDSAGGQRRRAGPGALPERDARLRLWLLPRELDHGCRADNGGR